MKIERVEKHYITIGSDMGERVRRYGQPKFSLGISLGNCKPLFEIPSDMSNEGRRNPQGIQLHPIMRFVSSNVRGGERG